MNAEMKALLQRIALAAIMMAFLALFFSTALGLVDGDLVERFGLRLRVTGFFLLLGVLPICLAWPRPSTTLRQSALRTLLDICALSAIHGAYLYWYWQSVERAQPFFCIGLALYCGARIAGIELDRSKRITEAGAQVTSAWSVLRPRVVIGLLAAVALGTLAGLVGKILLREPSGLFPMIRGGVAFTVCALFPGLVGKWMMEVAYREMASASEVSEDSRSLTGRRAFRRGCIVGGVLVLVLPALAGALTMNVEYAVAIAITGHIGYWAEFLLCYWDWKRGR